MADLARVEEYLGRRGLPREKVRKIVDAASHADNAWRFAVAAMRNWEVSQRRKALIAERREASVAKLAVAVHRLQLLEEEYWKVVDRVDFGLMAEDTVEDGILALYEATFCTANYAKEAQLEGKARDLLAQRKRRVFLRIVGSCSDALKALLETTLKSVRCGNGSRNGSRKRYQLRMLTE